jgi:site-specific recombinase XerD
MQLNEARRRYIRWLLAPRDLSPHTIRAYDGDLASLERYLGAESSLGPKDSRNRTPSDWG